MIVLKEPTKQDLLCHEKDQTLSLPRVATALLQLPTGSTVYEATVDLSEQPALIGWDKVSSNRDLWRFKVLRSVLHF